MSILDQFQLDGQVALAEVGADSQIEREVTARGRNFKGYACDFADRAALYQFISHVTAAFPVIDILVNNAGIILCKPAVQYGDDYWDKIIEVNLNAQFILTRGIGKRIIASVLTFQGGSMQEI